MSNPTGMGCAGPLGDGDGGPFFVQRVPAAQHGEDAVEEDGVRVFFVVALLDCVEVFVFFHAAKEAVHHDAARVRVDARHGVEAFGVVEFVHVAGGRCFDLENGGFVGAVDHSGAVELNAFDTIQFVNCIKRGGVVRVNGEHEHGLGGELDVVVEGKGEHELQFGGVVGGYGNAFVVENVVHDEAPFGFVVGDGAVQDGAEGEGGGERGVDRVDVGGFSVFDFDEKANVFPAEVGEPREGAFAAGLGEVDYVCVANVLVGHLLHGQLDEREAF